MLAVQFLDRAAKLSSAQAQFTQQSSIFNCDGSLMGEAREQRNLPGSKGTNFLAENADNTNQLVLLEHWYSQQRAHASKFDGRNHCRIALFKIGLFCGKIGDLNGCFDCRHTTEGEFRI